MDKVPEYLSIGEPPMHPDHRILYSSLNDWDRGLISNGCGPRGGVTVSGWKHKLSIKFPQWASYQTCCQHDIDYWVGGTEADRKQYDRWLLENIKRDAHNYGITGALFRFILIPLQAWIYYLAVRRSSDAKKHFHYAKSGQPRYRTFDQLKAFTTSRKPM